MKLDELRGKIAGINGYLDMEVSTPHGTLYVTGVTYDPGSDVLLINTSDEDPRVHKDVLADIANLIADDDELHEAMGRLLGWLTNGEIPEDDIAATLSAAGFQA